MSRVLIMLLAYLFFDTITNSANMTGSNRASTSDKSRQWVIRTNITSIGGSVDQ